MSSAAILTGGRATRFGGRDKGSLLVAGRSIRDRQIDELSQFADDILIVGAADDPAPGADRSVRHVQDRVAGCGPLGGLDAALAAARHDSVIVLAGDMPFVTAAFLRYLLSLTDGVDAVVPRTEDGYHPLCAAYTRACLPVVARRLAERRLAVTGVFDDVRTRVVTSGEIERFGDRARLLANVNTPAAFDELDALRNHKA